MSTYVRELPFTPASAGTARHWARDLLEDSPAAASLPDIVLVLSELVTNALRYGAAPVRVRLTVRPLAVEIVVEDGGDGAPQVLRAGFPEEGGHGLRVVEHLASAWGCEPLPGGGKSVRAVVALKR